MTLSYVTVIRSVAAVAAGIGVNVVLSLALDGAFQSLGVLPPAGQPMSDALHLLPFGYRAGIAVLGFYVVARLAPHHPLRHAMGLAAIAFALTMASTLANWSNAGSISPQWFQMAMLALLFPMAWLGAWLAARSGNARSTMPAGLSA